MTENTVKVIIVGAGHRAADVYASYALEHPDRMQIVGVADPDSVRRERAARRFGLSDEQCHRSAEELAHKGKIADAIINGTMDADHVRTSIPFLHQGYDVLLEKPFAISESEVESLTSVVRQTGRKVMICHVLRYAPFYKRIFDVVQGGEIGQVINMQLAEHVSYHHSSATYVRGKWNRPDVCGSSFLMAKSCHDLDLMMWFKSGVRPVKVASFGGQHFFRPENAPCGAGSRCLVDCSIEADCEYSAKRLYLEQNRWSTYVWHALESLGAPTRKQKEEYLESEECNFGRCVWRCDNDQVDRQSVMIDFEDGSTATFNLVAGTARPMRKIHIIGTKGEVVGVFEESRFQVLKPDPRPGHEYSVREVDLDVSGDLSGEFGGHGGGDGRLVEDFVNLVQGRKTSSSCTRLDDSVHGHMVGFLAQKALQLGKVMCIPLVF